MPFNDIGAMEAALAGNDVAGVVLETIPATYGFPLPEPGYLQTVKRLCEQHGALYIADSANHAVRRISHGVITAFASAVTPVAWSTRSLAGGSGTGSSRFRAGSRSRRR